jgi:hypothetical protein
VLLVLILQVQVNLQVTVSWPVCLGIGLPSDDCGFLDVGRPLWREDGSVIYLYNCCWALPEQSLLGRSPAELTAIFYCLIWDYPQFGGPGPRIYIPQEQGGFPFVASYDPQDYSGGILTRLHMGRMYTYKSESHVTTDGQSVCLDVEPLLVLTCYMCEVPTKFLYIKQYSNYSGFTQCPGA